MTEQGPGLRLKRKVRGNDGERAGNERPINRPTREGRGEGPAPHSKVISVRELRMILISRSCCTTRLAAFMRLA